jgi:hypothetical protein
MGEVKPQDHGSGLVERRWERKNRRAGVLTERTLEGERVKAAWLDRQGHVQRVAGTVVRNADGELAIESLADGIRSQTPVTRDANVDVIRPRGR